MSTRALAVAAGVALWCVGPVAAQDAAPVDPPAEPEAAPTGMDRPEAAPLRPVVEPRATQVRPERSGASVPGLEDQNFLVTRAPLRAEGTFLVRQPGSMVRLKTGEWVFVFHRAAEGAAERPMVLVPSGTLARMERVAQERGEDVAFLVTGQVFVYQGLNYLLPTAYTVAAGPAEAPAEEAAPIEPDGAAEDAVPAEGAEQEPAVEDLIRELESQRSRPRTISRREPEAPSADGDAGAALTPEGQFLTRRRGRLVRLAGGEWALAFEADADSEAALDAPMVVTPSLNLQQMEATAARLGESAAFEVSGRVLAYGGRNYLVPTMFRAYPPSEVRPMQ